ncbi:CLUMA_CG011709, isoform A [Clunio marinus]|uniref:CLUMA_CG011709, isoform A n=1 Tax=Clunio marinus TaxID=568069 RepID=A0A1J1IDK6_9DIPT|nr:CLUMA_CG011709, isoform A [Clunio marinus]
MRSWVWEHFVKKSENIATCKICERDIKRNASSTKAMINHLLLHDLKDPMKKQNEIDFNEANDSQLQVNSTDLVSEQDSQDSQNVLSSSVDGQLTYESMSVKMMRSWVWEHFLKSENIATCKICQKEIKRTASSTTAMINHLLIHDLTEPIVKRQLTEMPKPVKNLRSWVWKHFVKTGEDIATCKICQRDIKRTASSTTAMRNHLLIHDLKDPMKQQNEIDINETSSTDLVSEQDSQDSEDSEDSHDSQNVSSSFVNRRLRMSMSVKNKKSWVWEHFVKKDEIIATCKICQRDIKRNASSTTAMRNHLLLHDLKDPMKQQNEIYVNEAFNFQLQANSTNLDFSRNYIKKVKMNEIKKPAKMFNSTTKEEMMALKKKYAGGDTFDINNCYLCDDPLGPYRNSLMTVTDYTKTFVYETIECFTGKLIESHMKDDANICQSCFISIQKYDELQKESEKIQNKMIELYNKTHSKNKLKVKKEDPDLVLDFENGENKDCLKCKNSLRTLLNHDHSSPVKKFHIDSSKISENFKKEARKKGINYNYEIFQRTFFSENEIDLLNKCRSTRPKPAVGERKEPRDKIEECNEKISTEFLEEANKQGIDYGLEAFQHAFGYNEAECSRQDKKEKNENQNQKPKLNRKTVDESFLETMAANGIKHGLDTFQKAFGSDVVMKSESDRELEKEIRENGYTDCPICGFRFTNRTRLHRHMTSHRPKDKELYCEKCARSFKNQSTLHLHLATDHGRAQGSVDCPICFKTYQDTAALRSHFYTHTLERNLLCGKCGKTFAHKKSFEMHMLAHDDVRPFPCTHEGCSKKFRAKNKLVIHLRVHTGEKIFECPHCPGKRFSQKWGMDLHIKKQHKNIVPSSEVCRICNIKIQNKSKLRLHLINIHQVADDADDNIEMRMT